MIFLFSGFYNLLAHGFIHLERAKKPGFWLLTLVMVLVFLLCSFIIDSIRNHVVKRWRLGLSRQGGVYAAASISPPRRIKTYYYLLAVLPLTFFFILTISLVVLGRPGANAMFWNNLIFRAPAFMAFLLICATVILRSRPFVLREEGDRGEPELLSKNTSRARI